MYKRQIVPLEDVITDGNGDGVLSNIEYKGRLEVRELKDDPSRILGFACYRNGEGHGDISNYGEYALFNEDREAYCEMCIRDSQHWNQRQLLQTHQHQQTHQQ